MVHDLSMGTKKLYGYSGKQFCGRWLNSVIGVKAKSLLAGGQSGDPGSPHFDDQVQRYIDVNFKDVAYYREDVEARAEEKYSPGNRTNRYKEPVVLTYF